MKHHFFLLAFLLSSVLVSGLTIESGVVLQPTSDVNFTVNTTIELDALQLVGGALLLDDDNITLNPASGSVDVSINSWPRTTSSSILLKGTGQNVPFTITSGGGAQVVVYNGLLYGSQFTALTSYKTFTWQQNYNLTLNYYDENTGLRMVGKNVSTTVIGDLFGENYTTLTGKQAVNNILTDDYIIQYDSNGYTERIYYFQYYTGVATNLTLYLINTSQQSYVTINVYDTLGNTLEGARVKISKYFTNSNSYELVEIVETNFEGKAIASLQLDTRFYKFIIEYEGRQVLSTNPTLIYATSINFFVDLTDATINTVFNQFAMTGSITYDDDNERAVFVWNDKHNTATGACLKVYRMLQAGPSYQGETCANGPSGTAYYHFTPVNGQTYHIKGYVTRGGVEYLVSTYTKQFSNEIPDKQNGLFFMFIIMVAVAFIFLWDSIVAIIAVGFVPLLFTIAGLTTLGYTIAVPLFALCLVVAVVIGVNRR